jgi:NADH-quinone oxidoreductase subunit E
MPHAGHATPQPGTPGTARDDPLNRKGIGLAQQVQVSESDLERVRELLRANYHPRDFEEAQELILSALQDVQHMLGWVSHDAAKVIAEHLGVTENRIFGLLTFYADFRTAPPGNHFMLLCHGTACYVSGSSKLIAELQDCYGVRGDETTADGELTVQIVNGCLGVCDIAPVVHLDHVYYGRLDVEKFNETIAEVIRRGPAGHGHVGHGGHDEAH